MMVLLLRGISIGFAAGVSPGPLQIFLIMQTLKQGARHGLWLILAPLISDAPIITIVLVLLGQASDNVLKAISFIGGVFVLYIAWGLWHQIRNGFALPSTDSTEQNDQHPIHTNLRKAVIINALGPGAWLFWGTVSGPIVVAAWRDAPQNAFSFVMGFYATFLLTMAALVLLFHQARRLGARAVNMGLWVGLVVMVLFGASLILQALDGFL
jgi:threonine/homoserine/homoserine lactone efflux protein